MPDHWLKTRLHAKDCLLVRRLQSLWGWHWRCEERALNARDYYVEGVGNPMMALLLVCKAMWV
jgi:hypothetical protein